MTARTPRKSRRIRSRRSGYDELDDIVRTLTGTTYARPDHRLRPLPRPQVRSDPDARLLSNDVHVHDDGSFGHGHRPQSRGDEGGAVRIAFDADHVKLVEAHAFKYETDQLPAKFDQWLTALTSGRRQPPDAAKTPHWAILDATPVSQGGSTFTKLADGSFLASGKNADFDVYTFTAQTTLKGITAVRIEALADPSMVKGGPGRAANGNFDLTDFRVTAAPLTGRGTPATK